MVNNNAPSEISDYIGHRQRLKERFSRQGLSGLHDYEVLELLLGYVILRRDVKPLAKELLRKFETVKRVLDAPLDRLQAVAGMGPQSAQFLKLCRELLVVYLEQPDRQRQSVTSPEQIGELCRSRLEGLSEEHFLVLFLDNRHRLIVSEVLQRGTVDMSVVYPREVLTRALLHRAAALLVAHNHPGGSPTPSNDDLKITQALKNAAATLDIRLLDHLIVAGCQVVSLKELGHL
ncbi:MAG: DNA repair protein RadC [Deltaproteobacteria bacterium]|nr:DNA repair protein RadC [Deltaproteobacteria bacterium]